MLKIAGIDHIVLRTPRLDVLVSFYCDVLGCRVERKSLADMGLIQLRAGNALIDLVDVNSELGRKGGDAPGKSGNSLDHFCLQLEKISETELTAHLQGRGITVGEFVERYGADGYGRSMYINDPDGNRVELKSKAK